MDNQFTVNPAAAPAGPGTAAPAQPAAPAIPQEVLEYINKYAEALQLACTQCGVKILAEDEVHTGSVKLHLVPTCLQPIAPWTNEAKGKATCEVTDYPTLDYAPERYDESMSLAVSQ